MLRYGLILAAVIVVLDQASKWLIIHVVMDPHRIIEVTPFFNIVLVWNRGISFGLFNNGEMWVTWILSVVAIGIAGALVAWLRRVEGRWLATALGFVIGGAIGNVLDRIVNSNRAVTDFLDFHLGAHHFPAFNVADSAISVGVVLLLIDSLIEPRGQTRFEQENNKQD